MMVTLPYRQKLAQPQVGTNIITSVSDNMLN